MHGPPSWSNDFLTSAPISKANQPLVRHSIEGKRKKYFYLF